MRWTVYRGPDPTAFVVSTNITRRHLTVGQRAMLAVDLLPLFEVEAVKRRGGRPSRQEPPTNQTAVSRRERESRELAAQLAGTSGPRVSQARRILRSQPRLAEQVRAGTLALDAAYRTCKTLDATEEEQRLRQIKVRGVAADANGPGWQVFHGDFRKRLPVLPDASVDLVVADLPYACEYLGHYDALGKLTGRVLVPNGILLCVTGQMYLPEVLFRLEAHLNFGWVYNLPLPGANSRVRGRRIHQAWKPVVAFSNGTWPSRRISWHPDSLEPTAWMKGDFRWEQNPEPIKQLLDVLCPKGGTVLDPAAGTGAYGMATMATGRQFIGCEADAARYATLVRRLSEAQR